MIVKWYGTATVSIEDGNEKLLFDPFVRMNKKLEKNTELEGFAGADAILITHGHFDHIYNIPELVKIDKNVPVYCTKTPAHTLEKKGVSANRLNVIAPGEVLNIGSFKISVYHGQHVKYDKKYIAKVVPNCAIHLPRLFNLAYINSSMPEAGEIVVYVVEKDDKKVMVMGSLGYDQEVEYPDDIDLFVMPFGGSLGAIELGMPFVEKINPKAIMPDHHDNAFPPMTRTMDIASFGKALKEKHPDVKFIIPTELEEYTV